MQKYLGFIKIKDGNDTSIITKTYDDIETINMWFSMHPGCDHLVVDNTEEIDRLFMCYKDPTPITEEEKEADMWAHETLNQSFKGHGL